MRFSLTTLLALLVFISGLLIIYNHRVMDEVPVPERKPDLILVTFIDCVEFHASLGSINAQDLTVISNICIPDEGDDD